MSQKGCNLLIAFYTLFETCLKKGVICDSLKYTVVGVETICPNTLIYYVSVLTVLHCTRKLSIYSESCYISAKNKDNDTKISGHDP